jgi:hypothetical protein
VGALREHWQEWRTGSLHAEPGVASLWLPEANAKLTYNMYETRLRDPGVRILATGGIGKNCCRIRDMLLGTSRPLRLTFLGRRSNSTFVDYVSLFLARFYGNIWV